jgi:2-polyprenyl-6-methoxyphenol hydroxylase-like FAD-dependent oxidoreductase
MGNFLGRRAVVVGAGIGGLSAAGVLARYFEQVDILERDNLPTSVAWRSGTPQDRHPHVLLAGGLQALGEIFPGIEQDLARAGAVPVKVAQDIRNERADVGPLPQRDFGRSILCASRPLIEHVLRRRVQTLNNVVLQPECRVAEFLPATRTAAPLAVRFDAAPNRSGILQADLVVEASGRGALTLALLDALGWDRPEATEIGIDISYATVVVPIPNAAPPEWKVVLTLPDPPALARNGVLLPVEGNRWIVMITDYGATPRLESWPAFLEQLRGLHTPTLYHALRHAEPPEGIRHYGFPASLWRHFERLPRLPRGVLPIADSLCRFNPIYGQGMSSAAKQARLLLDVLERSALQADPITAAQTGFMAEVASILQSPWSMSANADFAFPDTRGEKPEKFEEGRQFEAALFRAAVADPVVHRAVMDVAQLLQPDDLLRDPDILRRLEEAASAKSAA